jgi:hypothetical protein
MITDPSFGANSPPVADRLGPPLQATPREGELQSLPQPMNSSVSGWDSPGMARTRRQDTWPYSV